MYILIIIFLFHVFVHIFYYISIENNPLNLPKLNFNFRLFFLAKILIMIKSEPNIRYFSESHVYLAVYFSKQYF